jgi:hypothetical protein
VYELQLCIVLVKNWQPTLKGKLTMSPNFNKLAFPQFEKLRCRSVNAAI